MQEATIKTTVSQRAPERKSINDQITEFFSSGGKIEEVPATGIRCKNPDLNRNYGALNDAKK
jgi:hypothetical protein